MKWGVLKLGEHQVGPYKLVVEEIGELKLRYARLSGGNVEKEVVIANGVPELFPAPPTYLPEPDIARHVMLSLEVPVVVAGKSEAVFYVSFPLDLGVLVSGEIIDAFPLGKVKLALYGLPERGVLCRYFKCRPMEKPAARNGEVVLEVLARNNMGQAAELTKIVVPASIMEYYLHSDMVYAEPITINITSPSTATVTPTGKKPVEGEAYRVSGKYRRSWLEGGAGFTMLHGY